MIDNRLRVILADRYISVKELAAKTGLSRNTISQIVTGKSRGVNYETLDKLCEYLEITPGDLLEYTKKDHSRQ